MLLVRLNVFKLLGGTTLLLVLVELLIELLVLSLGLVDDFEEKEAEWRIFGRLEENPKKYPESTSLQKNAKRYLQSGKKLGNGLGLLKEL